MKKNNLVATLLIFTIVASALFSLQGVIATNLPANIAVSVKDIVTDSSVSNALVYAVKYPHDSTTSVDANTALDFVYQSKTSIEKANTISLATGLYSVGAYHPDYGWAVKVVNITSADAAKSLPLTLKLKPVAENWTDLNGNTYSKLTSWPFLFKPVNTTVPPTITPSPTATPTPTFPPNATSITPNIPFTQYSEEITPMSLLGIPVLLDERDYSQIETKVGEVYSTQGLSVSLALKFGSGIDTKVSANGGPLSVVGSTSESSTTVVTLPTISNGDSRNVLNYYNYKYELWYFAPGMEEVWSENGIYSGSAHYDNYNYPSPSYKSLDQVNDIFDSTDTPSYNTKTIERTYSRYQSAGWSLGASVTLSDNWNYFSGSVSLGGSFSFTSYSSNEAVYTLGLQGGRIIDVYEWGNGGGSAAGTVLTYQNKYWVSDYLYQGTLSGQGNAWDAQNLVGQNNGNYAAIYGGNPGDAGYIRATMNTDASGQIYVYGYGLSGYYYSHLYTYVSTDNVNWQPAGNVYVNYWDNQHYINAGSYSSNFRYIIFVGYDDNGYSVNLRLDAVHVVK
jgi:hypothetical protein